MESATMEKTLNGAEPGSKPADAMTQAKEEFLDRLAEGTKSYMDRVIEKIGSTGATTVFGQPVERDDVTVIPVARAMWGIGGGTGPGKPDTEKESTPPGTGPSFGNGAGGGVMISPVGYIEIKGDKTRFRPIRPFPVTLLATIGGITIVVLFLRGLRWRPRPGTMPRFGRAQVKGKRGSAVGMLRLGRVLFALSRMSKR